MRAAIAVLISALLVGCGTTPTPPTVPDVSNQVVYHPPLPRPTQVCYIQWKVLVVEGQPYVALSYEDNINFAICAKDLERYLSELNLVVCHYRQCDKDQNATIRTTK